jgi:hypothetical protein
MLQQCFAGNSTEIGRRLEKTLCMKHSCHGRLHKLLAAAVGDKNSVLMRRPAHEWHDDVWTEHTHHGLGVAGLVLVATVMCYYTYRWLFSSQPVQTRPTTGNRLLRKTKKKPWHPVPSAPTTFIGQGKPKQQ